MKHVKYIKGYTKTQMAKHAIEQGVTTFQMDYCCEECGSDIYRACSMACLVCRGAQLMQPNKQVLAREMYLTGNFNLSQLSTKLNVPLRDVRWHLLKTGLLTSKNARKPMATESDARVIMNLSRQSLLSQGHSGIRASSILQIFKEHTPKSMRAVTRWQGGQIVTVARQVIR